MSDYKPKVIGPGTMTPEDMQPIWEQQARQDERRWLGEWWDSKSNHYLLEHRLDIIHKLRKGRRP